MFIRPALDLSSETEGARLKVRDPDTMAYLMDEGEEKLASEYWLRRLVEGGVEEKINGRWPRKKATESQDEPVSAEPDVPLITHEEAAP